jgi:hypothetical protein
MCPVCIATAAVIAGKVTSAGGVTALALTKFRKPKSAKEDKDSHEPEGNSHELEGDSHEPKGNGAAEDRVARGVGGGSQGALDQGERIHPAAR